MLFRSAGGGAVADGEEDGVGAGGGRHGFEVKSMELGQAGGQGAGGDAGVASDHPAGIEVDVARIERHTLGGGNDGVAPEEEVPWGAERRDEGGQEQAEGEEKLHGGGVLSGLEVPGSVC